MLCNKGKATALQTLGFQKIETTRISIKSAHERDDVVSPRHRSP